MKDVVRKNVQENIETLFQMELARSQFLVKNLTLENIIVRLGSNKTSSMIPAKSFEVVYNNIEDKKSLTAEATNKVYVTSEASGIVEVASIDF